MKDNRLLKIKTHEIEEVLKKITDTEVLINFQDAIIDLYPRLIPIYAFCYDTWDQIVEHLFNKMVWWTFSWKYGVATPREQTHQYAYEIALKGNYIECIPKNNSIRIMSNSEWVDYEYSMNQNIVFKEFADGIHCLTGSLTIEEAENVTFQLVRADVITLDNSELNREVYIEVKDLEFEVIFGDV